MKKTKTSVQAIEVEVSIFLWRSERVLLSYRCDALLLPNHTQLCLCGKWMVALNKTIQQSLERTLKSFLAG